MTFSAGGVSRGGVFCALALDTWFFRAYVLAWNGLEANKKTAYIVWRLRLSFKKGLYYEAWLSRAWFNNRSAWVFCSLGTWL